MDKDQVAEILLGIGTLLELKGENPFKTRAYANAARTIETLPEPLAKVVAENRLGEIKGIGEALQQKITELVTTGKLAYYDELKASVPPGLLAMLEIPSVGPKKVKMLYDELGIESVEQLEAACKENKIAGLKGFGSLRREVKYGANSRIDILLEGGVGGRTCYVEIKNVHLMRKPGLAEFPDSKTERGVKHLEELAKMVAEGHRAVMVYLIQRGDAKTFTLASSIDPAYAAAYTKAKAAGVEMLAYRCRLSPEEITLDKEIEILAIS